MDLDPQQRFGAIAAPSIVGCTASSVFSMGYAPSLPSWLRCRSRILPAPVASLRAKRMSSGLASLFAFAR